jgi:cyclin D7
MHETFNSIHQMWEEAWMVELVSVACLSIACKLDEVNIPSLHDLQVRDCALHASTCMPMHMSE